MVNIKKWALILTVGAFLLLGGQSVSGTPSMLFTLTNLTHDSDFETGISHWLANNGTLSNVDYTMKWDYSSSSTSIYFNYNNAISDHAWIYLSFDVYVNDLTNFTRLKYYSGTTYAYLTLVTASELSVGWNHVSVLYQFSQPSGTRLIYIGADHSIAGTYTLYFDNIVSVNLTAAFGSGYEPSIDDFELLYLPQNQDYFNSYTTMMPESYIQLQSSDYPNLLENISVVDFDKSIISNYGENVDLEIYAYVFNTGPVSQLYDVWHYVTNEHPEIVYLGKTYTLSWEVSDYSAYVIHLVMSDQEKDILKRVLFNRNVDVDTEYFTFNVSATAASYTKLWFQLSSAFDLKVNIQSLFFSRDIYTENTFNVENTLYYKFFDLNDNLLLPAIKMGIGDVFETRFIDVGTRFTDISRFNIEIETYSPDYDDPATYETHYFYELGLFSDNDIFIPGFYTESELNDMFPNQVCDLFEIGCQVTNLANNFVRTLYSNLQIGTIIAAFDDVFGAAEDLFAILPEALRIVTVTIIAGVGTGFTIVIVERVL